MAAITRVLDLSALVDPGRCPSCGCAIASPRCPTCGVDLSGPAGAHIWDLSHRIVALVGERDTAVQALRRRSAPAPSPMAPPAPREPRAATPPAPPAAPPAAARPPAAPAAPGRAPVTVQSLLVGLGALLLSVAAIVFLVRQWDALALPARALVVAAMTTAVLVCAGALKRALPSTAEALGALAVVLLLGDAWAVRHTDLFGAGGTGRLAYWAAAVAAVAVVTYLGHLARPVRAWSVAAVVLAPMSPVLLGAHVAATTSAAGGLVDAGLVYAGLGAVGAIGVAGAVLALGAGSRPAERAVAVAWTAAGALLSGCAALLLLAQQLPGRAAVVLTAVAMTGAVLASVPARGVGDQTVRAWWWGAGLVASAASCCTSAWFVRDRGLDGVWTVPVACVAACALLLGAAFLVRRVVAARPAGDAVMVGAGVPALAAVLLAAAHVLLVPAATIPAWRGTARAAVGALAAPVLRPLGLAEVCAGSLWAATVLACAGLAGAAWVAPWRQATHRAPVALAAAGMCAITLVLHPQAPVFVAVTGLAAVATLAAAAALLAGRGGGAAVAVVSAGLATWLGWAAQPLTSPVLLASAACLAVMAARIRLAATRAWICGAATAAVLAAVWALPVGWAADVRHVAAGVAGAGLAMAAMGVRRLPWEAGPRLAVAITGGGTLAAAVLLELPVATRPDRQLELLLAAVLLLAVVVAVAAVPVLGPGCGALAQKLAGAASTAITPAAAALAITARFELDPGRASPAAATVVAATTAVAAMLLAALVEAGVNLGQARRRGGEAGVALTGVASLALLAVPSSVAARTSPTQMADVVWVVLLLLGVAAAANASADDRRQVGWLSGVLLTASTWTRLAISDVSLVEAYTVPPALALLAVAGLRLRRRGWYPGVERLLVPALALAFGPSVVACLGGPALRPLALLAVAAVLVAGAQLLPARVPDAARRLALLTAGLVAAGAGVLRALATQPQPVERWTIPAAIVLLAAGAVAVRIDPDPWSRGELYVLPGLLLATAPSLLAASSGWAGLRCGLVLAVGACGAVLAHRRAEGGGGLGVAFTGLAVVAAARGLAVSSGPVIGGQRILEAWLLPVAVSLLAVGAMRMRRRRDVGSWRGLGPGLAVLLVPSLLLSLATEQTWRTVGLLVVATVVVVAGSLLRLQAPVVLGSTVLVVHILHVAGPSLLASVAAAPRWAALAGAGAVLLALGARLERNLADVQALRGRLASLR